MVEGNLFHSLEDFRTPHVQQEGKIHWLLLRSYNQWATRPLRPTC